MQVGAVTREWLPPAAYRAVAQTCGAAPKPSAAARVNHSTSPSLWCAAQSQLSFWVSQFGGMQLDMAMRDFLSCFKLPGEAQQIDRIIQVPDVSTRPSHMHEKPDARSGGALLYRPLLTVGRKRTLALRMTPPKTVSRQRRRE